MADPWAALPEWTGPLDSTDQVLLIAGTGGAKSTLAATLTLPVTSLVAVDEKANLTLPGARVFDLAKYEADDPSPFETSLRYALAWEEGDKGVNRRIIRPNVLDVDDFGVHDAIFRGVYERTHTVLWLDEITATGATAQRIQPWLKAITARGRTRGVGLMTCSQAPYGLIPPLVRRNATFTIIGSIDPQDARQLPLQDVEICTTIPRYSGRFLLYRAGEVAPYRLYLPIPDKLKGWRAP